MEQKKKGTFGKIVGVLISVALMAALAVGFVSQYPRITKDAKEIYSDKLVNGDYGVAREYFGQVCELLYGFHVQYAQEILRDDRSPGEILMSGAGADYLENYKLTVTPATQGTTGIRGNVHVPVASATPTPTPIYADGAWESYVEGYAHWHAEMVDHWNEQYETHFMERAEALNVKYCIWSIKESKWCGTNPREEFTTEKYPLVIRVEFYGGTAKVLYNSMYINLEYVVDSHYADFKAATNYIGMVDAGAKLLDGTILYIAADENLFEGELADEYAIYWYRNEIHYQAFSAMWENYVIFAVAALGIVVLLALILSVIKPLRIRELWLSNIPAEILVGLVVLLAGLMMDVTGEMILITQMSVDFPHSWFNWSGIMEEVMAGEQEGKVLLIANAVAWFGIFTTAYFSVISVLQIFYKGFFEFLKKNTILGRILCFLCGKGKQLVDAMTKVDFKDKGSKKVLFAVIVNFAITFGLIFGILWLVGVDYWYWSGDDWLMIGGVFVFFALLIYHILLYLFLMKKWNLIRLQYTELLETTEEMASGDTKVTYNGKPGIFRELQEKLVRVQTGFDTAVQEEVKSQRMKSELITNVSHDLKTPLTAIITYVDLLKNEEISAEERREYVQVLEQKSARLKTLIEDLFEVSKATSGNIRLNPQELDLVHLIQEVQLNLEDRIMQSGIQFKLTVPQEKVIVCLDGQKTCRIFENLFVNITKYGLYGSRAFVDVETLGEKVRVTIKNVSATEITYASDEIMERFTRGDASRNTEGSGLGLAIVKSFVEAQGGTVEIQLDGDLFKVIVEFPRVIMPKQDEAEAETDEVETMVEVPLQEEAEAVDTVVESELMALPEEVVEETEATEETTEVETADNATNDATNEVTENIVSEE